jgi:hypothetical protein
MKIIRKYIFCIDQKNLNFILKFILIILLSKYFTVTQHFLLKITLFFKILLFNFCQNYLSKFPGSKVNTKNLLNFDF